MIMAVQSVTERHEHTSGDTTDADSGTIVERRSKHFDVVHDRGDSDALILAHPDIPQPNTIFGTGSFLTVRNRHLNRGLLHSQVEVEYESVPLEIGTQNPVDVEAEIEYETETYTDYMDVDQDGNRIETVLKEDFDPIPQETFRIPIYSITRPVPADPSGLIDNYLIPLPAINADMFYGRPPGALLIWDLRARKKVVPDVLTYWILSCKIARRDAAPGSTVEKAWWLRVKAQGFLIQALGVVIDARRNGQMTNVPLRHSTSSGEALSKDDPTEFYEFKRFPVKSYSWLAQVLFS